MRTIPEEMTARIESGAAMLCHAWVLRRADGTELGFTDHDRDLVVEGLTCRAASGWAAGAADSAVGLSAGSAAVAGGLDDAAITDADVEAGLYDGAEVTLWRVDWDRPDLKVRLWTANATTTKSSPQPASVPSKRGPSAARLPLIWRAGPAGGPPGGVEVSEVGFAPTGVHDRPWSPAHLRAKARGDGGFDLNWIARLRVDGDRWDGEALVSASSRFRVRVLDGEVETRAFEVEAAGATYAAADLTADFPGGPDALSRVAVAEWGDGYGWGMEARVPLTG